MFTVNSVSMVFSILLQVLNKKIHVYQTSPWLLPFVAGSLRALPTFNDSLVHAQRETGTQVEM